MITKEDVIKALEDLLKYVEKHDEILIDNKVMLTKQNCINKINGFSIQTISFVIEEKFISDDITKGVTHDI